MFSSSPRSPSPSPMQLSSSTRNATKTYSSRTSLSRRKRRDHREENTSESDSDGDGSPRPAAKASKRISRIPKSSPPQAHQDETEANGEAAVMTANGDYSSKIYSAVAGPSTPKKQKTKPHKSPGPSPKDLSSLFSPSHRHLITRSDSQATASSSASSPSRKGTLGRQMLTKTQSLGLNSPHLSNREGDSGPSRTPTRTSSLPSTPSKSVSRTNAGAAAVRMVEPDGHQSEELPLVAPGSGGKAKRVYGRGRSFRDSKEDLSTGNLLDDPDASKTSYNELRRKFEVDNSSFESAPGEGNLLQELLQARAPQNVSDMRSKGENRRFMDEIGYLADGIADPRTARPIKQSSSVDLLVSAIDREWLSRAGTCGQIERIWNAFSAARDDTDGLMDTICLLFLSVLRHNNIGYESIVDTFSQACVQLCLNGILHSTENVFTCGKSLRRRITLVLDHIYAPDSVNFCEESIKRMAASLLADLSARRPSVVLSLLLDTPKEMEDLMLNVSRSAQEIREKLTSASKDYSGIASFSSDCLLIISSILPESETKLEQLVPKPNIMILPLCETLTVLTDVVPAEETNEPAVISTTLYSLQILASVLGTSPRWVKAFASTENGLSTLMWIMNSPESILRESTGAEQSPPSSSNGLDSNTGHLDISHIGPNDLRSLVLAILFTAISADEALTKVIANSKMQAHRAISTNNGLSDVKQLECWRHVIRLYEHLARGNDVERVQQMQCGYLAMILSQFILCDKMLAKDIMDSLAGKHSEKIEELSQNINRLDKLQVLTSKQLKLDIIQGGEGREYNEGGDREHSLCQNIMDRLHDEILPSV